MNTIIPTTNRTDCWALLVDEGERDRFGVLLVLQVVDGHPPVAVHYVRRSASIRALAESGWRATGTPVARSWGLAIPVEPAGA